jgi:hypothetical protein
VIWSLESAGQLNLIALTNHVDDSTPHSSCSPGNNGSDHDATSFVLSSFRVLVLAFFPSFFIPPSFQKSSSI